MALAFAPYGKEVRILRVNADEKLKRHLDNLGLIVGANVTTILDNGGDIVLRVHESRLAINKALAMKITVA